jgi:hypothetical protein
VECIAAPHHTSCFCGAEKRGEDAMISASKPIPNVDRWSKACPEPVNCGLINPENRCLLIVSVQLQCMGCLYLNLNVCA